MIGDETLKLSDVVIGRLADVRQFFLSASVSVVRGFSSNSSTMNFRIDHHSVSPFFVCQCGRGLVAGCLGVGKTIYKRCEVQGVGVFTLLFFAGILLSPAQSFGVSSDGDSELFYELDPVVVTATRTEISRFEAPYTVDVIDRKQMRRRAYRSTPQMLRDVPGILIQETSVGQGSPFIRGFTGFRNVFLIDGIRLNNSVFREGPNQYWNTVDPYSIERLEVVKGQGAVQFGTDAVGGTVNAITKGSTLASSDKAQRGEIFYRTASAENSHVGRAEAQIRFAPSLRAFAGGTGKHYGNFESGGGTLRNTGYDEWNGDIKLQFEPDDNSTLTFACQRVLQNNVPRTHRTIDAVPYAGSRVGTDIRFDLDQERQLAYAQYRRTHIDGMVDSITFSVSWHQQDEVRDRIRLPNAPGGALRHDIQGVDIGTLGVWAQLESETKWGNLLYGIDYYRDFVESFSSRNAIQGPVGDDSNYDLGGIFLQDTIVINDRWETVLGARGTYAYAKAGSVADLVNGGAMSVDEDWSSVVGSARLLYRAIPNRLNLFSGVSQAFRAPNLSDLTRFNTARSGETEIPATGLDPEKFVTMEIGAKWIAESLSTEVAGFYTDISDQIVRFPTGGFIDGEPAVSRDNIGEGWVSGVEFSLSYRLNREWIFFGTTTFQQGEMDAFRTSAPIISRDYLSRTMPWMGQVGLRWTGGKLPVWGEIAGVFAGDADKLSTRDIRDSQRIPPGGTPGWSVIDIRLGWAVNDHLQLVASLDNVSNEDYRLHGSGQNSPGRNLILSATASF